MSHKVKTRRTKSGLPPGTAVYTGNMGAGLTEVTVMQYSETVINEHVISGLNYPSIQPNYVTWYDIKGLSDKDLIEYIGKKFNVHALAIEDALNTKQRPKWDDYENGIFIIARALRLEKDTSKSEHIYILKSEQICFFIEKNVLISFQEDPNDTFLDVRERLHKGIGKIRAKGTDYLAYVLLDTIVDEYINILDYTEEEIDNLEDDILTNYTPSVRSDIYRLKRRISDVRRAVVPLRDVINRFVREEGNLIDASNHVYIRDLYDHIVRVIETVDNQQDMLMNLNDLFNSEASNRANHVVRVLTVVSAIFIPLTFIVGVYGTNFDILPELHMHNGYYVMWGVMIVISILQLIYFRYKKWL